MTATTYLAEPEVVLERSIRTARRIGTSEVRWALQCLMDLLAEKEAEPVRDEARIAVVKAQIEGYSQALLRRGAGVEGAVEIEESEVEEPRKPGNSGLATHRVRASLLATEKQLSAIKRMLAERNLAPEAYGVTMERLEFGSVTRISKDKASDMLDKLDSINVVRMMSDGQRDLLAKLTVEGHANVTAERAAAVWAAMQSKVTFDAASKMIDRAIAANKKRPAKKAQGALGDGFYERGEEFFKVQIPLDGGKPYAKRLVVTEGAGFEWVYEYGLINEIQDAQPLSPESAAKLGAELKLYGRCFCCNRRLTDETSIEVGIGRICREKHGW